MQKFLRQYLVLALVFLSCGAGLAQKVILDKTDLSDPRLSQPVTVECVNVRLHTALDEISRKTGITILCGKTKDDWKVRDVPVLVCTKGLPLRKLLETLTDVTHLTITSYEINGIRKYRMWRTSNQEKELAAFEEARKTAALAAASYDWDTLSQVKDLPDSALRDDPQSKNRIELTKAISKVLSDLGPEAKEKVLSGEPIILTPGDAPESIKGSLNTSLECLRRIASRHTPLDAVTEESQRESHMRIRFGRQFDYPDKLNIEVHVGYTMTECNTNDVRWLVRKDQNPFPPRPKVPEDLGGDRLSEKYSVCLWPNTFPPSLQTKVKLDKPKDKKHLTYADALAVLSEKSGYSIIAEDFESHRMAFILSLVNELPGLFGREISIQDVLKHPFRTVWHLDEENNLILGWDKEWTERLKIMVPEKLLKELAAKMSGTGIVLDDLDPVADLSWDQCREWICYDPELQPLFRAASDITQENSLWKIYFSLSTSGRARAKTEQGASLVECDSNWIADIINANTKRKIRAVRADGYTIPEDSLQQLEALTDNEGLPTLVLRLKRLETKTSNKYRYMLEIEGEIAGKKVPLQVEGELSGNKERLVEGLGVLPVYTPEREAELSKKKQTSGPEKK